ncbi:hypothetical protein [Clostridium butyricum]|uniref:hypothetical protein n=1 Tax=Clostridium butyricum TaxID=1492 RepID=UPI0018AC3D74|nr:hypothetical protein [Clostridium butyricum]MDB2157214.1 hypothetical protein [Clostridium butyricum]
MKRHGLRYTRLYSVWIMMKQRCFNKSNKDYYNYGARGITVCNDWLNVQNFYSWAIDNGYKKGCSLDRIEPNANYEPSNCRWTDSITQANNKRNTIKTLYKGKSITLTELSNLTGISRTVLEMRYIRGDREDRLIRNVRKRVA